MQITAVAKMDRGLAYGESCFETFRVIDGAIFDWPGHLRRLAAGLAEFAVLLSSDDEAELRSACLRAAADVADDCLLRLTVSGGPARWGLLNRSSDSQVSIQCMPYLAHSSPVALKLQRWPFPIKQKIAKFSADYAETLRALRGADDVHVVFEQGGYLLATATANVLMYRQGHWFTPPAEAGVLPGRVRACLLDAGVVDESLCPVNWLDDCEAVMVSNSAVFLQPVAHISNTNRSEPLQVEHKAGRCLFDALSGKEGVCL